MSIYRMGLEVHCADKPTAYHKVQEGGATHRRSIDSSLICMEPKCALSSRPDDKDESESRSTILG